MTNFTVTTATRRIVPLRKRIRLLAGGMRASKTISVLMCFIDMAESDYICSINNKRGCLEQSHQGKGYHKPDPKLASVVSESFPHLRRGAIRDFESIMRDQGRWVESRWHKTEFTYTFQTGSQIEFFSADVPEKVRGPSRDRLFANEVNNIPRDSWEQLLFRTRELAFADWNPVGDFYMYEDYGLIDEPEDGVEPYALDDRVDFLILTYKDNESLESAIVEDIERKAEINPGWARVYAQGLRGSVEGKIFSDWKLDLDEIPHEARLEVRGLDFGYAKDPSVLVDIYRYNGGYILDERIYRTQMKNYEIGQYVLAAENSGTLIIGDSAESEGIAVMQEMGVNIIPVEKKGKGGRDFTNVAIDFVQSQRISVTKRSVRLIDSYRNFMWQTDKDGKIIGNPPKYDHYKSDGMMAVVYGMTAFAPREEESVEYSSGDFAKAWL